MPTRVYTASKIDHARLWMDLHILATNVHWTARWPAYVIAGMCDSEENAPAFWLDDESDVTSSSVCLVYSHNDEPLRGALVEAGIALAAGVQVLVVGKAHAYGTWQFHPQVEHAEDLAEALEILGVEEAVIEKLAKLHPTHFSQGAQLHVVE